MYLFVCDLHISVYLNSCKSSETFKFLMYSMWRLLLIAVALFAQLKSVR